jgi:hypothetical protein
MTLFWWIVFFSLTCRKQSRGVEASFYHWTSRFALDSVEQSYFSELNCKRIYVRFFDVDVSDFGQLPISGFGTSVGGIKSGDGVVYNQKSEIVPVVFITNRVWLSGEVECDSLAARVMRRIGVGYSEIQFDSDWTVSTRERYFGFLKSCKLIASEQGLKGGVSCVISATIRLHQIAYPEKTGVPPVDRGVLMCYNTENMEDVGVENSILNPASVGAYLKRARPYPLHLDVALPLFGWGIVYRNGEVHKLINKLTDADLLADTFFRMGSVHHFELKANHYLKGYYLNAEDEIRIESVSKEVLGEVADLVGGYLSRSNGLLGVADGNIRILFYHLDSGVVGRYSVLDLKGVVGRF